MKDTGKSKQELIAELTSLRARLLELDAGGGTPVSPVLVWETCDGIFSSFPFGILAIDRNGVISYVNPAFVRISGYRLPELGTEKQWFQKAFPDRESRRKALSVWVRYQTSQVQTEKVFQIVCKNGRTKTVDIDLSLAADGTVISILAEAGRIADEERFATEKEEQWRLLLDIMNEGFVTVNEAGIPVFANQRLCDIMGYSREEIIGRPLALFLDEDSLEIFQEEFSRRSRGEKQAYEIVCRRRNGERRHLILSPQPLYDRSGRFVGSFATCMDITERKEIEEELRQSQRRYKDLAEDYRAIVENSTEGIYRSTPAGRYIMANHAFARLLGYDSPEALLAEVTDIGGQVYVDAAVREDTIRTVIAAGRGEVEVQVRRRDGSLIWLANSIRVVYDQAGEIRFLEGVARDITKRKEAERALEISERKYHALFNLASVGIVVTDASGGIMEANPAWQRMTGYTEPEYRDLPPPVHYISQEERRAIRDQLAAAGMVRNYEVSLRHKDNHRIVALLNSDLCAMEGEKVILSQTIDITARKREEEILRQSEERYRMILSNIEEGYNEVDLTGRFTFFNASFLRLTGRSHDELLGAHYGVCTDKENQRRVQRAYHEVFRTGRPLNCFSWDIFHKDGARRHIEVSVSIIRDTAGRPTGFRSVARDVTERREAEDALRRSEDKYRRIFDNSVLGIYQTTPEGRLINANAAMARILGYESPESLMASGTDIKTMIYALPEDRDRALAIMEKEGVLRDFEVRCRQKNGGLVWVSLNARPVRDDRGRVLYHDGTGQDIDDRKRAEAALQEIRRRYEELRAATGSAVPGENPIISDSGAGSPKPPRRPAGKGVPRRSP